jgi:agmatinase
MGKILTALPTKGHIVGFDLFEVNLLYDSGEMTSQLAARIALDFLGAIQERKREVSRE